MFAREGWVNYRVPPFPCFEADYNVYAPMTIRLILIYPGDILSLHIEFIHEYWCSLTKTFHEDALIWVGIGIGIS